MLEDNLRAAIGEGSEGQLDLGQQLWVVGELRVQPPRQQQPARRVVGDHISPGRLGPVCVALEPAAAREGFDDDLGVRAGPQGASLRPPIAHPGREQLERALRRRVVGHSRVDRSDRHSAPSASAKVAKAAIAAVQVSSSQSLIAPTPLGSSR